MSFCRFPRFAAIRLLSLTLAFGLAGCTTGSEIRMGSHTLPAEKSAMSAEPEATLKFYFGGEKKAATDEVWTAVSDYVKTKGLDVKFSVQFIPWPEYSGKLLVMAAAGDRWDLNFDTESSFRQMASRGSYLRLNDLLPIYAPHLYERYRQQHSLLSATIGGDVVGLPWTIKMNQRPYAGWRADLAEKAGIYRSPESVQTVEDVDRLLHDLKKAYPNHKLSRIPSLSLYLVRDEWVDLGFYGLGFYLNDPKYEVRAIEDQPFYADAAFMSRTWYKDGILNPDSKIDYEDGADQWRNGKMLFTLTSHEWAYAADPGFADTSFRQQMSLLYPDKKTVNRSSISNVAAINRNSEHPELVLQFLDLLETDERLFDLVIYGIQGKTYELDGGKVVYPDNLKFSTSNYMDWGGQWVFWKPQFLRPTETYPEDFWKEEARFAELPVNVDSPVEGLLLNDQPISDLLEERDQIYEDFGKSIEFGMEPDVAQALSAYREKQRKNSLDTIISEVQRQVDQFLASQHRDPS
ncbi:extracellular solute-binding protein [Paenibacillus sp. HJL G12]|uniref:Extracellular solute-binding protein n=2 Tax=Paenibacillus dendrobii TaxID=2691084 RepID=A0A7X3IEJ6_9BACL|nr:extracellular solute-binding protein [Paenibacillus dendrobii]